MSDNVKRYGYTMEIWPEENVCGRFVHFDDYAVLLARAKATEPEASPWIACAERMPEPGVHVLGWLPGFAPGFVWLSDMPSECPACKDCPPGPHLHGALWPLKGCDHVNGSRATHWKLNTGPDIAAISEGRKS